ncbi:MAG TPA: class I SAM-dependent methyltransferase [Chitinophagales bacterium]|nr:class I SAM-dependent methyltransferase [Chitinophagales bacterium]
MKIWILKATVQKIISCLPFSHRINFLFQKYITRGVDLTDEYFEDRLEHLRQHLHYFEEYSSGEKKSAVELGTGWYPIIPVAMSLYGFEKIFSLDIHSFVSKERLITTLEKFSDYYQRKRLPEFLKKASLTELETLIKHSGKFSPEEILKELRITLLIQDARQLPFENNSVDLITSNNTFEHVYPSVLMGILKEFKRVVKSGGVMSHFIDMSDHFAHLDKSITIYNFLKFSDKQWKRIDNSIQPQNRWRMNDYEQLYDSLQIPVTEKNCRAGDVESLQRVTVNKKFKNYSAPDLAISHCYVISKF